ncbi:unnamed protein product [Linum tenue]|uniref:Uncharacterized protein n=1 Tax=Linum tenue TaxID=586396 RepID=A0AAV0LLS7_9ROSI|nr:unnamed protein product [Linum tenue]
MEGIKQLKIEVLEQPPSTAEFASIIESRNVPAVILCLDSSKLSWSIFQPQSFTVYSYFLFFNPCQVSIMNSEDKNKVQLEALREDIQVNQVLDESALKGTGKPIRCTSELLGDEKAEWSHLNLEQTGQRQELPLKDQQQDVKLNQLEPFALQALHELVSLVHDHVNLDQSQDNKTVTANLYFLEDDRVAKIIWSLDPQTLQNVLLAMHSFPRTLEALVLHLLSPVGAEVLTRKFDEIDQQSTEEHRNKFYQKFYSAFDDQFGAMDAILNQKESFALQVFPSGTFRSAFLCIFVRYLSIYLYQDIHS